MKNAQKRKRRPIGRTRPEEEHGVLAVSFTNDITERKRLEEESIRSERVRTLGEMAADVAHNFNTLLAVVLGRAQFLLLHLEDGTLQLPEVRGNLGAIEQAALRAAATTRRLLDFTRETVQPEDPLRVAVKEPLAHTAALDGHRWKDEAEAPGCPLQPVLEPDLVHSLARESGRPRGQTADF